MGVKKPIPESGSPFEDEYWQLLTDGKLGVQHCTDCGQNAHPPRGRCPVCYSENWEFHIATGEGTVYGYTEIHRPAHPKFDSELPIVSAIIELREGPRIMATIDCTMEDIEVGTAVKLDPSNLSEEDVRLHFKVDD